ncbi:hypothetical protein [Thomasclavelia cocleata]|uniref:hypothetical protein n=2 Tax=Thomasclavelia cocleata TaxID=69824 RepID=UPI0024957210|nr:hypothetical protein [Thomasclavelia cocleata]
MIIFEKVIRINRVAFLFKRRMIILIKKIIKEIQKLESQKRIKLNKRNQLDEEINLINLYLKDLNNLKSQYKKLKEYSMVLS